MNPSLHIDPALLAALPRSGATTPSEPTPPDNPVLCKMILECLLRNIEPEKIAEICGISINAVEKYAQSAWFEQEVQKRAKSGDVGDETLRSLIRSRAFLSVIRLGKLINSPNENVSLNACKLALEYSLKKSNDDDTEKGRRLPSLEDAGREAAELQRRLSVIQKQSTL